MQLTHSLSDTSKRKEIIDRTKISRIRGENLDHLTYIYYLTLTPQEWVRGEIFGHHPYPDCYVLGNILPDEQIHASEYFSCPN